MNKNTKEYLEALITETISGNMDEMAHKPKGSRSDKGKNRKFRPVFKDGNNTEIPDYWIVNPTQEDGGEILAVPIGKCEDLIAFAEANKEWLEEIGAKEGLEPQLIACTRGKYHRPIEKAVAGGYQATGEKYSEREQILRDLGETLKNELFGQQFNDVLNKKSIPSIVINNRRNINFRNGIFSNNDIHYHTHNYNSYPTVLSFLNAVFDRFNGQESSEMKTYAMSRQFNQIYNNYDQLKKNEKKFEGLTPIQKKAVRDFEEENLDVSVRMDFDIKGIRTDNDKFLWTVTMEVKLGKKLSEDRKINEKFDKIKEFQSTQTVIFDPEDVDNGKAITSNANAISGLIACIQDIKAGVEEITLDDLLPYANVAQYQVGGELDESTEKLIKRIVSKIKL